MTVTGVRDQSPPTVTQGILGAARPRSRFSADAAVAASPRDLACHDAAMTARRRTGLALACALMTTALAGCSSSSGAGAPPPSGASSTPAPATSAPVSDPPPASVSPAATGRSPASPTPPVAPTVIATTPGQPAESTSGPVLILQTDGLGVLVGESSIRQLPFGTDRALVKQALTGTLGPVRASSAPECGQGPRTSLDVGGFGALFDGSRFVGWTDTGRGGRRLSTANGIGVGATLSALRAAFGPVSVTADTLGPEFVLTSGFGGLLDGTGSRSRITTLYAGETCFFR